jgi:hypothetical protein
MHRRVICNANIKYPSMPTFLPTHHGFSDLPFEQLGSLRLQLMGILKDEGPQGVKKFARSIRKDRRDKPVEVLRLDKSDLRHPRCGAIF